MFAVVLTDNLFDPLEDAPTFCELGYGLVGFTEFSEVTCVGKVDISDVADYVFGC